VFFFQQSVAIVYLGLLQALLFGWLYVLAVFIWEKFELPYAATMAGVFEHPLDIDIKALEPKFPFFSFGEIKNKPHRAKTVLRIMITFSFVVAISVAGYTVSSNFKLQPFYDYAGFFPLTAWCICILGLFVPKLPPAWTTRLSFGVALVHISVAMVWPILGIDFVRIILADAMTSACLMLFDLEYAICYFATGEFLITGGHVISKCNTPSLHYQVAYPTMIGLPFWIRFIQCLYRFYITRHLEGWAHYEHLTNAGKYFSAILVVVTSTVNAVMAGPQATQWQMYSIIWLISLVVKTVYCYVWDIMMDWDLGHFENNRAMATVDPLATEFAPSSRRINLMVSYPLGLRSQRWFPQNWIYYQAIIGNFFMRCSWAIAISPHLSFPPVWNTILALIEIYRRAQWLVFRTENEFFQKCKIHAVPGKERAIPHVPNKTVTWNHLNLTNDSLVANFFTTDTEDYQTDMDVDGGPLDFGHVAIN